MIQALAVRLRTDGMACKAYASVMVDGIRVNGVRVLERSDGSLYAQLPNQRDHTGAWFPIIELPQDVAEQVLDAALEAYLAGVALKLRHSLSNRARMASISDTLASNSARKLAVRSSRFSRNFAPISLTIRANSLRAFTARARSRRNSPRFNSSISITALPPLLPKRLSD